MMQYKCGLSANEINPDFEIRSFVLLQVKQRLSGQLVMYYLNLSVILFCFPCFFFLDKFLFVIAILQLDNDNSLMRNEC